MRCTGNGMKVNDESKRKVKYESKRYQNAEYMTFIEMQRSTSLFISIYRWLALRILPIPMAIPHFVDSAAGHKITDPVHLALIFASIRPFWELIY